MSTRISPKISQSKVMQEVCNVLRECREGLNLSRPEMTGRIGVTLPTYTSMEKGSTFSGAENFALAFDGMGVSFGLGVLLAESRVNPVFPLAVNLQMLLAFRKPVKL